jgi:peptide/nickel transport system substrate-binding protein
VGSFRGISPFSEVSRAAAESREKPVDSKKRLEAWAEIQQLVRDEVPWVFLWQQHDLYGVANWIEWTPRADERVWMYEAKLAR